MAFLLLAQNFGPFAACSAGGMPLAASSNRTFFFYLKIDPHLGVFGFCSKALFLSWWSHCCHFVISATDNMFQLQIKVVLYSSDVTDMCSVVKCKQSSFIDH